MRKLGYFVIIAFILCTLLAVSVIAQATQVSGTFVITPEQAAKTDSDQAENSSGRLGEEIGSSGFGALTGAVIGSEEGSSGSEPNFISRFLRGIGSFFNGLFAKKLDE